MGTESRPAEHEGFRGRVDLGDAVIGEAIGIEEFEITHQLAARNAWASDDYNPWYLHDSPFGGPIASPVFPMRFDGELFYNYYAYPAGGSLLAKEEFEYRAPLMVGARYRMVGRLADRYEKRGRQYYKIEISVRDDDDVEAMRIHKTIATPVVVAAPQ
jgi:hypothetical protein